MAFFGPISSLYDFATFAVFIYGFDAGETLFQSGWFVESLTTQTLVIFIIRTRRVPFLRSRPSRPLLVTTLARAGVGAVIPFSPLADALGFTALPGRLLVALALMVATYLALVEAGQVPLPQATDSRRATRRRPGEARAPRPPPRRAVEHTTGAPAKAPRSRRSQQVNGRRSAPPRGATGPEAALNSTPSLQKAVRGSVARPPALRDISTARPWRCYAVSLSRRRRSPLAMISSAVPSLSSRPVVSER